MDWEELQNKKLRKMIKLVYFHHPYYHKIMKENDLTHHDFNDISDLKKLPITHKEDILADPKQFVLQPKEKEIVHTLSTRQKLKALVKRDELKQDLNHEFAPATFFSTSGRTGMPVPSFLSRRDLEILTNNGVEDAERYLLSDVKLDKRLIQNTFPHAPHLAFWFSYMVARHLPKSFYYSFGTGRTELQADMLEKFNINIMTGMPFYIKHLSDVAKEKKIKSKVELILLGGEGAPIGMKAKIKENFSKIGPTPKIKMTYASSEMKSVLMECEEGSGYHIRPELHIWEVLDKDTLEPVGPGEPGVLAFSHIDSRGTVLLRYYTGDYVFKGIVNDKCPECGHNVPRITNKIERLVDMEKGLTSTKVKGNLVDFNVFDHVLSQIKELRQYRVLITKKDPKDPYSLDEIIIEVGVYKKHAKKIEQVKKNIISKFKAYTDITPKIKLKPAQQIFDQVMNTMKGVRIIDQRK